MDMGQVYLASMGKPGFSGHLCVATMAIILPMMILSILVYMVNSVRLLNLG
jgi:hypothetical protein